MSDRSCAWLVCFLHPPYMSFILTTLLVMHIYAQRSTCTQQSRIRHAQLQAKEQGNAVASHLGIYILAGA